jgi:hypothetical protein
VQPAKWDILALLQPERFTGMEALSVCIQFGAAGYQCCLPAKITQMACQGKMPGPSRASRFLSEVVDDPDVSHNPANSRPAQDDIRLMKFAAPWSQTSLA